MPVQPSRLRSDCPHCGQVESLSEAEVKAKLRALGMLRREDERGLDFLLQLAAAARLRLTCPSCGGAGLSIEAAPEDEWDSPARACAACGAPIPAERLELFPELDLCATCQGRVDRGQSPDQHDDFCPRCGTRMTVRQRRGSGIAGYKLICPACTR